MVSEVEEGAALDDGVARFLGIEGNDGQVRLSDIRSKAANELRRYGDDVMGHLAGLGITVPPAIQLASSEGGRVCVLGDHPAKDRIESFINGDTRLLKWFKEVEVLHEIMRRAELSGRGEEFSRQHFNLGLTSIGSIAFFAEG